MQLTPARERQNDGLVRNVAEVCVGFLARSGVRRCYTVPGEGFIEFIDAVDRHADMQLISTRHESGASFMADADAKLTGMPAVVVASRGPGASNLAIGVHTAREDSTPMVVILGQVSSEVLGREAFQEVDLAAFYAPITKWARNASSADRVPELIAQAFRVATNGRPGPAVLVVPADFFGIAAHEKTSLVPGASRVAPPTLTTSVRDEIAGLLYSATRPVFIAGDGARWARDLLVEAAEHYGAGVYTAFRRQDVFPNDHALYLGHLGIGTPEPALHALRDSDVVLVVGSRLGEITTQDYELPASDSKIIQIDVEENSIGAVLPVNLGVVAEAGLALQSLLQAPGGDHPARDWSAYREKWVDATSLKEVERGSNGVHPLEVIGAMADILPPDAIVTNDAGNFSAFLHRYWKYLRPHTQLAPTSGAMGYGVPSAVAAKLALPERTVVSVVGDGGILMTGHEIETAVRYGAPICVVVFKNGMYGTIAMHQAKHLSRTAGVQIGPLDLASYARGLGARGMTVDKGDELRDALAEGIDGDTPAVIDVRTDPDVISPSALLSELLENESRSTVR